MLSTMLKPAKEVYTTPPLLDPHAAGSANCMTVWTEYELASYFKSSIIIALGAMVLNTLLIVPAAYAVARLRFVGRKVILYLLPDDRDVLAGDRGHLPVQDRGRGWGCWTPTSR